MNLSLAHPPCCGCLPCLNRRKGSQVSCDGGVERHARLGSDSPAIGHPPKFNAIRSGHEGPQAGKAGSVSGAPRVYASWIDDDPTVAELEFLDDKEDPLAPAKGGIFAACMGAVIGGFIVLCVIALFQRVIH